MWLLLAFVSATLLGFYDASKKAALKDNAVLPVLLLNTLFSTVIFSPFLLDTLTGSDWFGGTIVDTAPFAGNLDLPVDPDWAGGILAGHPLLKAHLLVILKSVIVLTSWIAGYFGIKHIPITIVGPINAFLRRKAQLVPVDRSFPVHSFHLYDESFQQEGKHRLHT